MANDINIDNSVLLRQYSIKLKGFASSINIGCRNLVNTIEHEENELNRTIRDLERLESNISSRAEKVISRYDDAKRRYLLDDINSAILGNTDMVLWEKLIQLRARISLQKESVKECMRKLHTLKERTEFFSTNTSTLSERGSVSLNRHVSIIDDYKHAKK